MTIDKFEQFLKIRQGLLYQYKKGDLSKDEFISQNYYSIENLGIQPFKRIDNAKKAIYNYQYYNVLAKYYQRMAHSLSRQSEIRKDYIEQANYYYYMKDKVTTQFLKLIDFKSVNAYFVKVQSHKLNGRLFEIVITDPGILIELDYFSDLNNTMDCNYVVLHSMDLSLLSLLRNEGVFSEEKRKSITDKYINEKY